MRRTWLALLFALALTLAACATDEPEDAADEPGDDDTAQDDEAADDDDAEMDESGDDDGEAADGEPTVMVADTSLGEALVDSEGMTLYVFDNDEPGVSVCYDDCAANWPPLLAEEPVAGDGADDGLLGTTERDDGTVQVTYGDRPLYYWAGDSAPGDVNGQGVSDIWWVVAPDGSAITDATGAEDTETENASNPYGY